MSGRPTPRQPIKPEHPPDLVFRRQLPSELGEDTSCHEDRNHRGEPEAVHGLNARTREAPRNRVFPYVVDHFCANATVRRR